MQFAGRSVGLTLIRRDDSEIKQEKGGERKTGTVEICSWDGSAGLEREWRFDGESEASRASGARKQVTVRGEGQKRRELQGWRSCAPLSTNLLGPAAPEACAVLATFL